jgi:hypothetical protein
MVGSRAVYGESNSDTEGFGMFLHISQSASEPEFGGRYRWFEEPEWKPLIGTNVNYGIADGYYVEAKKPAVESTNEADNNLPPAIRIEKRPLRLRFAGCLAVRFVEA